MTDKVQITVERSPGILRWHRWRAYFAWKGYADHGTNFHALTHKAALRKARRRLRELRRIESAPTHRYYE